MMETQPVKELNVNVVPPPQTVEVVLSQTTLMNQMTAENPCGAPPSLPLMTSRNFLFQEFEVTTDTTPGTVVSQFYPVDSDNQPVGEYDIQRPYRPAVHHATYFTAAPQFTLWAIKPPMVTGRLGIFYVQGARTAGIDKAQRTPLIEWDLSASAFCTFSLAGLLSSNLRPTFKEDEPEEFEATWFYSIQNPTVDFYPNMIGTRSGTAPMRVDSNYGHIYISLLQRLQVGSLYPQKIRFNLFVSYPDLSLRTIRGPCYSGNQIRP